MARSCPHPVIRLVSVLTLILAVSTAAFSWGSTGHRIINLKAVMHLPDSMSTLKKDSLFYQAHASDADNRKNYSDTSFYSEAERHYIDIDWYPDYHSLPRDLSTMFSLYGRTTVHDQGTLPWATVMVLDSLTAQLRRGSIAKAESTMADLGHYVADGHQPLHCTQNYDGQLTGNGGIHSRYESTMINQFQSGILIHPVSARYIASPIDYVFDYLYVSNSYVDSIMAGDVYAKAVSGWSGSGSAPGSYYTALWAKVGPFTQQLFQQATVDLASLWYTAWLNSRTAPPPAPATILATITGGAGIITPSGSVSVPYGHDTSFTWQIQTGHHLDSVLVDDVRVDSLLRYTFRNVIANHTLHVDAAPDLFTITCGVTGNGSVTPEGVFTVPYGQDAAVTFQPQTGYHVDSVLYDNTRVDSLNEFTFRNVTGNHSLMVYFSINFYTITAASGPHGSIDPSGVIAVAYGSGQSFTFTPDSGYVIDKVFVDDLPSDSTAGFTFAGVAGDHSITVLFSGSTTTALNLLNSGWNMISLPVRVDDGRTSVVLPGIISRSFGWQGNYVPRDTLVKGAGYWVKMRADTPVSFTGGLIATDTIDVTSGWNLIGSISSPVPAGMMQSVPAGLLDSRIFGYRGRYIIADTIRPGSAYWVHASGDGKMILAASSPVRVRAFAGTIGVDLIPPPPPGERAAEADRAGEMPVSSGLRQVYPNPFNPSTRISFAVGSAGAGYAFVRIGVYDVLGREVTTLVNEIRQAGEYTVQFDAGGLPSGVYFLKSDITGAGNSGLSSDIRKIVLNK